MATEEQKEIWRAYNAVERALDRGDLVRPQCCEKCGKCPRRVKGVSQIQAHHYKGYDTENQLKVKWLCPSCNNLAKAADTAKGKTHAGSTVDTGSMMERLRKAKEGRK